MNLEIKAGKLMKISPELEDYYVFTNSISNLAYTPDAPEVKILAEKRKNS